MNQKIPTICPRCKKTVKFWRSGTGHVVTLRCNTLETMQFRLANFSELLNELDILQRRFISSDEPAVADIARKIETLILDYGSKKENTSGQGVRE